MGIAFVRPLGPMPQLWQVGRLRPMMPFRPPLPFVSQTPMPKLGECADVVAHCCVRESQLSMGKGYLPCYISDLKCQISLAQKKIF